MNLIHVMQVRQHRLRVRFWELMPGAKETEEGGRIYNELAEINKALARDPNFNVGSSFGNYAPDPTFNKSTNGLSTS